MKRQQPTERQPCIIRNLARADPISEAAVQFAPVPGVSGESLLARPAKMSDDNHMPFQEKDQESGQDGIAIFKDFSVSWISDGYRYYWACP